MLFKNPKNAIYRMLIIISLKNIQTAQKEHFKVVKRVEVGKSALNWRNIYDIILYGRVE